MWNDDQSTKDSFGNHYFEGIWIWPIMFPLLVLIRVKGSHR